MIQINVCNIIDALVSSMLGLHSGNSIEVQTSEDFIAVQVAHSETVPVALQQGREISVAIGILMERHKLSAEAAFDLLRTHARNTRSKTSEVAKALLAGTLRL